MLRFSNSGHPAGRPYKYALRVGATGWVVRKFMVAAVCLFFGTVSIPAQIKPAPLEPAFEINTRELSGFIRPIGEHNGLILSARAAATAITKPGMVTWNLEHYCKTSKGYPFYPRNTAIQGYEQSAPGTFTLKYQPTDEWKVAISDTYSIFKDDRIEVKMELRFEEDYKNFEVFVASYFAPGFQVFLPLAKGWVTPEMEGTEQHFFPRDASARVMIDDGRWNWLAARKYPPVGHDETYAMPLMVSVFRGTTPPNASPLRPEEVGAKEGHWAWIQMTRPEDCLALSPNVFAPAHDFSLLGADVRKGETRTVRARLLWKKLKNLDEIKPLYENFLGSLK